MPPPLPPHLASFARLRVSSQAHAAAAWSEPFQPILHWSLAHARACAVSGRLHNSLLLLLQMPSTFAHWQSCFCPPPLQERLPWEPLLTDEEVQRAQGYYGSGNSMRRAAAKLLAGQPIKASSAGCWHCQPVGELGAAPGQ